LGLQLCKYERSILIAVTLPSPYLIESTGW